MRVRAAARLFRRNERQAEFWKAGDVEKYQAGRYDKIKLTSDYIKKIYKDANDFEQGSDNSSVDNTNEPWNLKNKHYAIRRLICKEEKKQ